MNCPHCNIEIDEHEANRCLDEWVARAVLNNYDQLTESAFHLMIPESAKMPRYSTDIAAAWEVVERGKIAYLYSWMIKGEDGWDALAPGGKGRASTAPLAICRAALRASA